LPFIRHSRDKRGYDTTYVMHAYRPQRGPQQTRVLYLFRSPSYVKLGRRPLDDEAREALEHTHPDVSFDWTVLGREAIPPRAPEHRDRGPQRPVRPSAPAAPPPQPVQVILDDHSLLGRVVGAERAARLRAGYADLLQRVARRARTPEDRDRLLDRAHRLNPDDTVDEAALREAVETVEASWAAIVDELPARRRGRRAGRRRPGGAGTSEAASTGHDSTSELSVIIDETQPGREGVDDAEVDGGDRPDVAARDDRDRTAGEGQPVDRLSSGE
jgi:hypothetical protein